MFCQHTHIPSTPPIQEHTVINCHEITWNCEVKNKKPAGKWLGIPRCTTRSWISIPTSSSCTLLMFDSGTCFAGHARDCGSQYPCDCTTFKAVRVFAVLTALFAFASLACRTASIDYMHHSGCKQWCSMSSAFTGMHTDTDNSESSVQRALTGLMCCVCAV